MAKDDLLADDWDGNDSRANDFHSLSRLKMWYIDWVQVKFSERDEANQARRYYHDDQIDEHAAKKLRDRHQPIIVYNLEKPKINAIVGLMEKLRQNPQAYPRHPSKQAGADIATYAINEALDQNQWEAVSSQVELDSCIEPVVGVERFLKKGLPSHPDDKNCGVGRIDPRKFFYDPRARLADLSDARYMGMSGWFDLDDAIEMFPDREEQLRASIDETTDQASAFTGDNATAWVISSSKKVRLVEMWYKRHGKWLFCFFVADYKLREGISPHMDENGLTEPRFIVFSAHVDHDFDRYGFHRTMKGMQDETNARRSKALHLLNTQRMKATEGGFKDIDAVRDELHKPDGIVEVPPGTEFEPIDNMAQFEGNVEMMKDAREAIDAIGPNPSLIGQMQSDASGRAIQLMQQAGVASLGPFIKNWRAWKLRVYRALFNDIERNWTAERWIRVSDPDNENGLAQFIQVNGLGFDQFGQPSIINAIGSLDVEIKLDEGGDHIVLTQDIMDALVQLKAAGVPIPPQVIIEMAGLPAAVKQRVLQLLTAPNPEQQQAQQLEMQNKQADTQKKQASAQNDQASAMHKLALARTMHSKDIHQVAQADKATAEADATRDGSALDHLQFAAQLAQPQQPPLPVSPQ